MLRSTLPSHRYVVALRCQYLISLWEDTVKCQLIWDLLGEISEFIGHKASLVLCGDEIELNCSPSFIFLRHGVLRGVCESDEGITLNTLLSPSVPIVIDSIQLHIDYSTQVYYDAHRDRLTFFYSLSHSYPGWDCKIQMYNLKDNSKVGEWCTAGLMTIWCSDTHVEGMLVIDNHLILAIQSPVSSEVLVGVLQEGQGATYLRSIWQSNICVLPGSLVIAPYELDDPLKVAVEIRSLSDSTWVIRRLEKVSATLPYVVFNEVSKSTRDAIGHIPLTDVDEVLPIANTSVRLVNTYGRRDLPPGCRLLFADQWMVPKSSLFTMRYWGQMLIDDEGNLYSLSASREKRSSLYKLKWLVEDVV